MRLNEWKIISDIENFDKCDKKMIQRITTDKIRLDRLCDAQQNTYYGKTICGTPLHCSYGMIGYSFQYNDKSWSVDNELQEIRIED